MTSPHTGQNEPIAIIGTGCRFPGGATSPSKLWELLKAPRDLSQRVPKERFNVDGFHHVDGSHHGRTNAQYAYFLDQDPYTFDPGFFNIPPNEVDAIDPQQRLLLETVYEGLSAAGLRIEDLRGSPTAVYVGMMQRDFLDHQNYDLDSLNTYAATGTSASILSNRVSYVFDWHGPSMTLDTACSSSLVAVHHAVQQLRTGLSRVAVAAGTNLILGPIPFISASKLNMFSPTGKSRMWDIGADGYARGEGVAAVVLKTLSQAIADGDSIECVIRETGINQDGKTAGITMPSHSAQEALIRQVYKQAGLDITKPEDRCQYFEAHGTGTPAGDPQEAQAISSAFFEGRQRGDDEEPLYVGSIKTVIGHTEGTAGIAGLIKASQVIQHGILPPNMLFTELNPRVAPFYSELKVVTEQQTWPELKYNQPRRVSVNSFGFGGTNSHAIVEQHIPAARKDSTFTSSPCLVPVTLSAHSEVSLKSWMQELKRYLLENPDTELKDLVWTLFRKRSNLQFRHTVFANNLKDLCEALDFGSSETLSRQSIAVNADVRMTPRVLGIFTGQGAQWPAMGRSLITSIQFAHDIILRLDESLQGLPEAFRPAWKLMDKLLLEDEESDVHKAEFSQPLCCAVQIILVQLLHVCGIKFDTVVGHSSGEIACAFAAGFISANEAIRIAYLRGHVSHYASGPGGVEGAMMAVGTSFEDAAELCALDAFEGRMTIAASNGPQSVTLSGDKEALLEAQEILNEESKFNRLLKVEKAYHSHHMIPCSEPYIDSLKASMCDVSRLDIVPRATWISSVHEGRVMRPQDLTAEYWNENLLSPVLFSPALEQALLKHMPLDVCVEVGPHPTLKNPSLETIENCAGITLPYVGCMERKKDGVEAFSACLGYLWSHFGSDAINIDSLFSSLFGKVGVKDLSNSLPCYAWDHSRSYRKESRTLRTWLHAGRPHLLLGRQLPQSSSSSVQWQNFIRQRDIEWLDGHSLQGQTVFPGAGYVVMAMEAAVKLAGTRQVQLLEIVDLRINKAVTFEDEHSLVELNLTLDFEDSQSTTNEFAVYNFNINSCLTKESGLSSSATGKVNITYGPASIDTLPTAPEEPPHLNDVSIDRFYNMLHDIGYGYTKEFRGVTALKRGDSKACGTINYHILEDFDRKMVIHPVTLDVAFQSFIGAYTAPGDRRLRSILVPIGCDRIALNPNISPLLKAVSFLSMSTTEVGSTVSGDIQVYDPETEGSLLLIEGLCFKPFAPPSTADDHKMFSKWTWGHIEPEPVLDNVAYHATEEDRRTVAAIERITYWYIKSFLSNLTNDDRENTAFHFRKQIQWCEYIMDETREGRNVWYQSDWDNDSLDFIEDLIAKNEAHPFVRLVQRVGEGALETLQSQSNAFDLMDHDGLLTEFYGSTLSYGHSYKYYRTLLEQINHRHQNLDVVEIGAGTGGATRYFFQDESISCNSYTFTDISNAFFEQAAQEFKEHAEIMNFQPLDIRRDPSKQGFRPNSYDLVIASNVLHATPRLEETLANVRSLLKPGGQLIVIEVAHREHTRIGFIFGLFPDWWAGHDEGRVLEPFVSYDKWDELLKKAGFSGIDSRTLDPDSTIFPNGVFTSHAVNDVVRRLDSPLAAPLKESWAPLVIVGGSSSRTTRLTEGITKVLPPRNCETITNLRAIVDLDCNPGSTFLVLSELDDSTFGDLDHEQIDALQTVFNAAANVLWLTEDAWVANPQQAMMIGFLRTLRMEYPDINIQVLDAKRIEDLEPSFVVETLLRLEDGADWQDKGILWTQEPELYLSNGKISVPRLKPDVERNHRLNAGRRDILVDVAPEQATVGFAYDGGKPVFQHLEEIFIPEDDAAPSVKLQVQYSLPKAVRVGQFGYYHLLQGKIAGSEEIVATLAKENASMVRVNPRSVVTVGANDESTAESMFSGTTASLIAHAALANMPSGSSVAVLEPPLSYVEALKQQAEAVDVQLYLLSTKPAPELEGLNWIQLHAKEADHILRRKLPKTISVLYDMASNNSPASISNRVIHCQPRSCSIVGIEYFLQDMASTLSTKSPQSTTPVLTEAIKVARSLTGRSHGSVLRAPELLAQGTRARIDTTIDWNSSQQISCRILPIQSHRIFVDSKTYLLVGLAGDLGRSIARFMVQCGARHIVLSSRSPKVDQRWIDDVTSLGGNIMVLPMDVSDKASVDKGLAQVRASMPAIAGVAFGPLVLQDVMFKNMDLSMLEMVLAPKVTGARLLDERLSDPSNPLDFFVMFSSFVMVSGNPGQAAYGAANAYTHALAQQRRSRGMAGSTIDIGAVFGVGFIARAGREHEYDVLKFLFDEVNEWELHALFAEAVIAGRNKHLDAVELVTGMPYMDPVNRSRIPYFDDPRFAYFKMSDRQTGNGNTGEATASVKDQLSTAESMEQVRAIIIAGLSSRIRGALQLRATDDLSLTAPLIDQGIDSLSAVTISSWFSKNLYFEMPLLKILGGASITDLVDEAASRLTAAVIPLAYTAVVEDPVEPNPSVILDTSTATLEEQTELETSVENEEIPTPQSQISLEFDSIERHASLSLNQQYAWKQQKLPLDPTTFNSTIGMYMEGPLNLNRLAWAFNQALQRHDAFRTCFIPNPNGADEPIQAVMKIPRVSFETIEVSDRAAADQFFKDLEAYPYDLLNGNTLKVMALRWTSENHLLIIAYHRLVGDGWTTEHLFVEVSQLYGGAQLEPAPSYADHSLLQRTQLDSGGFDQDLDYWTNAFKNLPQRLPALEVPGAKTGPFAVSWTEHEFSVRLNPMIAVRVKDRSRKHKATPMHYYLASFYVTLARFTCSTELVVGIADTNRPTLREQATMGYFANLLPVRLEYAADKIFNEVLTAVKEQMRMATVHSAVPYGAILQRLGLADPSTEDSSSQAPLFQAVFDYKQGQAESGSIGEARIVESRTPRAGSPYDITLEISDDPTKDPLLTVKLQKERYSAADTETFMNAYVSVLSIFSRNPALRVGEGKLR